MAASTTTNTLSTQPNLSPTRLAAAVGMHKGSVSKALRGRNDLTLTSAAALARAAGISIDDLYAHIQARMLAEVA